MIVVTGAERSGTSMMMNILKEAGYPIYGDAYPNGWDKNLKEHNPNGFWESELRHRGINRDTLQNPEKYLGKAIKVLHKGLNNTAKEYVEKMIIMIRNPEEVVQSYNKLLENDSKIEQLMDVPGTIEEHYVQQYYFTFTYLTNKLQGIPTIVIDYNRLMKKISQTMKVLKDFLIVGRFDLAEKSITQKLYRNKGINEKYVKNRALLDYCKVLKKQIVNNELFANNNFQFLQQVINKINVNNQKERFNGGSE